MKTEKNFQVSNPDITGNFRLQDTATLSSYFWITLQQHAAYNG
jgi:hypothetical protein